jgi:hypothetical protein
MNETVPLSYYEGILQAETIPGMITYHGDRRKNAREDEYRHTANGSNYPPGMLRAENARDMEALAASILEFAQCDRIRQGVREPLAACFLGTGSGRECVLERKAHVTTVTLSSAINPFLRPVSWGAVERGLIDLQLPNVLTRKDRKHLEHLSVEFLLDLQRRFGKQFFDCLSPDDPFIHEQHVGEFTNDIDLPTGSQQFVYEHFGAIHYSRKPQYAFEKACSLLAPDGALFVAKKTPLRMNGYLLPQQVQSIGKYDLMAYDYETDPIIVLKEHHPVLQKFRKISQQRDVSVGVLELLLKRRISRSDQSRDDTV